MNKTKITKIFTRFAQQNPNPTTELLYHTDFELLIAVMLSAQATDKSVNNATQPLFAMANTPTQFLSLGEDGLKKYTRTLNLYITKTKNILKTCEILINKFNNQIPHTREGLESLPGVGRKTANVILNVLFKQITLAVDTHIFRVSQRIGLAKGKTPLAIEVQLLSVIPKKFLVNAHHWIILHGRYICKARKPECQRCFIVDLCEYEAKTS